MTFYNLIEIKEYNHVYFSIHNSFQKNGLHTFIPSVIFRHHKQSKSVIAFKRNYFCLLNLAYYNTQSTNRNILFRMVVKYIFDHHEGDI